MAATNEDQGFIDQIQAKLGSTAKVTDFDIHHCLNANGVEQILSAEIATVRGKRVLIFSVSYRRSYLGLTTTKADVRHGPLAVGWCTCHPKGWLLTKPGRWEAVRKANARGDLIVQKWVRVWHGASLTFADSRDSVMRVLLADGKWIKRGRSKDRPWDFPREERKTRPAETVKARTG